MRRAAVLAAGLVASTGCELTEVALATPDDVVVVEAYVPVDGRAAFATRMTAFLHRTLEVDGDTDDPPPATVRVERPSDGTTWRLEPAALRECVINRPVMVAGDCYAIVGNPRPGDTLRLEVSLADGRLLESDAVVPASFELLGVESTCALPPATQTELRWTRSPDTWAYAVEGLIGGLTPHVEVEVDDPLYLLGLAVSASDTTLVFPREIGIFERIALDRPVAVLLQEGLPPGTAATVTVTAVDRNWVNWARGGNFNPSGQVRVSSIRGAGGTGVFGTGVRRVLEVVVPEGPTTLPPCPPPPADEDTP